MAFIKFFFQFSYFRIIPHTQHHEYTYTFSFIKGSDDGKLQLQMFVFWTLSIT